MKRSALTVAFSAIAVAACGPSGSTESPSTTSSGTPAAASPATSSGGLGGQWAAHTVLGLRGSVTGVSCPVAGTCFAVAPVLALGSDVLASHDGGVTWAVQGSPLGFQAITITCTDASNCVAAGYGGKAAVTRDGGGHFDIVDTGASGVLTFLACASQTRCLGVGEKSIVITDDGGRTWTVQAPPTGSPSTLNYVACPSGHGCIAVGGQSVLTQDSGGAWTVQPVVAATPTAPLSGVACVSASDCVIAGGTLGSAGEILTSHDGGRTWARVPDTFQSGLGPVACVAGRGCVVVGAKGAVWTSTDLVTWVHQPATASGSALLAVSCSPDGACVAVGSDATAVSGAVA